MNEQLRCPCLINIKTHQNLKRNKKIYIYIIFIKFGGYYTVAVQPVTQAKMPFSKVPIP